MAELLTAQHLIKTSSSAVECGFNMAIFGHTSNEVAECNPRAEYLIGYDKAREMINAGKIFYTQRFKCNCGGWPYQYGGRWVCDCGIRRADEPWWIIKVQKDGNAWCCVGLDFEDLQSSDNYAFGNTRQEAINNYEKLMRIIP